MIDIPIIESGIDELLKDADLSEEEFCRKHPHSYLQIFKAPSKITMGSSRYRTTGIPDMEDICRTSRFIELRMHGFDALMIGRGSGNDILLDHNDVSRMHAMILLGGRGNYCVKDMGSENGTYIEQTRIRPRHVYVLEDGQVIRFSETVATLLLSPQSMHMVIRDYRRKNKT